MYLDHFGLAKKPFSIAPDPAFLYLSDGHREALAHLSYGLTDGGFVLVTGEVGTGKTTLLRNLVGRIPREVDVAFVLNPRLTVRELLGTICEELGIVIAEDTQSIKAYIDQLNKHLLKTHTAGRSTVVIIDEAQNLSPAVLEQLRLLTNLETNEKKLLRIILIGQPELAELLARKELRQLAQRITARYHLSQLHKDDAGNYVRHRIRKALSDPEGDVELFTDKAISTLYKRAAGIPRVMNVIADRSLLGAYVSGERIVDADVVKKAAKETLGAIQQKRPWGWIGAAAGLFLALAIVLFLWLGEPAPGDPALTASDTNIAAPANPATSQPEQPAPVVASAQPQQQSPQRANPPPVAETVPAPLTSDVSRPANTTPLDSQQRAFAALFELWKRVYPVPNTTSPCEFAAAVALQCLSRKGTWGDIEQLDLPVVLELWDDQKQPYYGALLGSSQGRLTIALADRTVETTARALRDSWYGAYVALWHRPNEYQRNLAAGDRGAPVRWIRQALAEAGFQPPAGAADDVFDQGLASSVIAFQRSQGITADGIVGPETWVQLQNVQRPDRPSLTAASQR